MIMVPLSSRAGDMEEQYVLPAIQLTLKNLQLDCLDLYLIHSPFAFRHNLDMSNLQDEDKLGYDESRIAGIWKVKDVICRCRLSRKLYLIFSLHCELL